MANFDTRNQARADYFEATQILSGAYEKETVINQIEAQNKRKRALEILSEPFDYIDVIEVVEDAIANSQLGLFQEFKSIGHAVEHQLYKLDTEVTYEHFHGRHRLIVGNKAGEWSPEHLPCWCKRMMGIRVQGVPAVYRTFRLNEKDIRWNTQNDD
jgi:hypothetical protein